MNLKAAVIVFERTVTNTERIVSPNSPNRVGSSVGCRIRLSASRTVNTQGEDPRKATEEDPVGSIQTHLTGSLTSSR